MMYSAVSSSLPDQTMGPDKTGASLSGKEEFEVLLCRLSFEDLGLSVCVDML